MSEAHTRRNVVKWLSDYHGTPIESPSTGRGIPDVFFVGGVVECKYLKGWPVNDSSNARLRHPLTCEQYRYLRRNEQCGGKAFVCLQANKTEWFLFKSEDAKVLTNGNWVPRLKLIKLAHAYWTRKPTKNEFQEAIFR